jgi:glutamine amidotransferase
MIAIIDSCGSNIASIKFALERLGQTVILTSDSKIIQSADYVILPGVGQARHAMSTLRASGLADLIPILVQPVLGICLGMQLLFEHSEEDDVTCLGIIKGKVKRFESKSELIIPHMGWNTLSAVQEGHFLFNGISEKDYVYYVHSYYAEVNGATIATNAYASYSGGASFAAIVNRHNFYGMQFHPEKSGKVGEKLLQNFITGSK